MRKKLVQYRQKSQPENRSEERVIVNGFKILLKFCFFASSYRWNKRYFLCYLLKTLCVKCFVDSCSFFSQNLQNFQKRFCPTVNVLEYRTVFCSFTDTIIQSNNYHAREISFL